jgi:Holliday junction resolvase RusA-like endonuclease
MKPKEIIINIKPLSVNEAWQGRRFKTDAYKRYERNALILLPAKIDIHEMIRIDITYYFSSKASDLDNPTKLILDILQKKYKFNDSRVWELHLYKKIVAKGSERMEIIIQSCLPFE